MVWTKDKMQISGKSDRSLVLPGNYILVESNASNFSFLNGSDPNNIFKRNISCPAFQVLKVGKKPIEIISAGQNHVHFKPQGDERMPMQIWRDKSVWNVASFLAIPYNITSLEINPEYGELKFSRETFLHDKTGIRGDSTLFYLNSGAELGLGTGGTADCYSFCPPTQVMRHLIFWTKRGHKIYSCEELDSKLEGEITPQFENALSGIETLLEKQFGEDLSFKR